MENKQVCKFKDLSAWLKIAAIASWVVGGYFTLAYVVGFVYGIMLYL